MPDLINSANQEYLGTGLSFPLHLNVQGGIKLSSEDEKVQESIWLILRTGVGERVYRPDFGCRLSELAFAPLNSDTLLRVRLHVSEALQRWEPRITLVEVHTDPDPVRGRIDITIDYRLKNYPDAYSLVYPFYLASTKE